MSNNSKPELQTVPPPKRVSPLIIFYRLTRAQFIPLIILPVLAGTALAYHQTGRFDPYYFGGALVGSVLLHLGANAIDDCYDFQNGVDSVANSMFPSDFGGWKPLPRRLITLRNAKIVSAVLYVASLSIGAYLAYRVGIWAIILGLAGVLLAHFYTAPPLKLDYRGLGFGEIAIFAAFGPITVIGAYYVQTAVLSLNALLISVPIGLMTVTILMDHDLIFYEVYQASRKLSLTTILGRKKALWGSLAIKTFSYVFGVALIFDKILPLYSSVAIILSALVLARKADGIFRPSEPPPFYVSFTVNALFSNWVFVGLMALTLFL